MNRTMVVAFGLAATVAMAPQSALAIPSICDAVAGNLVTNCGFEGGVTSSTINGNTNNLVPSGWTPNAGFDLEPTFNLVVSGAAQVNSGLQALSIGSVDIEPAPALTQTLADTSGTHYSGTIFVLYGGHLFGDPGAFFDVQINGTNVLALNQSAAGTYTSYSFSFVGTGSDTLTLTGNTNPVEWFVDDISVTGATTVPEPTSLVLLSSALFGFGLFRHRARAREGAGERGPYRMSKTQDPYLDVTLKDLIRLYAASLVNVWSGGTQIQPRM